jgi:hypothetical protein
MREKSYSIQALKAVLHAAKKYNAQMQLLNLHNTILSMYNPEAAESDDDDSDNITERSAQLGKCVRTWHA